MRLHPVIILIGLLLTGPSAIADTVTFPTATLDIRTQEETLHFSVEVATTDEQHRRGLMFRDHLAPLQGMIFIFSHAHPVGFWMKNTIIPLDMLFVDEKGVITGITANAVPESLAPIHSPGPVRAVIEIAGGSAERYHIASGDKVIYSAFP